MNPRKLTSLREAADSALDDLPRYFAVTNDEEGWLPGDGGIGPTMRTCVSVDDVRDMLRKELRDKKEDDVSEFTSYQIPRPIGEYPTDEDLRRLGLDLMRAFNALGVRPGGYALIQPAAP